MTTLTAAIIGASGNWGRQLSRVALKVDGIDVTCCVRHGKARAADSVDPNPTLRRATMPVRSLADVLDDPGVDAVIIATPGETHFALARDALGSGKHVFLEKPMCLSLAHAEQLAGLARDVDKVLFVDHTSVYSDSVQFMKEKLESGFLGKPLFIRADRTQLGVYRLHSVLWDLATHDISIIDHLFPDESVVGASLHEWSLFAPDGSTVQVPDAASYAIDFMSGLRASGFCSWCHPKRAREFAVIGSDGMLLFEGNSTVKALRRCAAPAAATGTNWALEDEHTSGTEPLRSAVCAFLDSVAQPAGTAARHASADAALRVVAMLEAVVMGRRQNTS